MWAMAFAALVGGLIPLLVQLRKPVAESEHLLTRMNAELPLLLKETRAEMENVNSLIEHARGESSMRRCCCMRRVRWATLCTGP